MNEQPSNLWAKKIKRRRESTWGTAAPQGEKERLEDAENRKNLKRKTGNLGAVFTEGPGRGLSDGWEARRAGKK